MLCHAMLYGSSLGRVESADGLHVAGDVGQGNLDLAEGLQRGVELKGGFMI